MFRDLRALKVHNETKLALKKTSVEILASIFTFCSDSYLEKIHGLRFNLNISNLVLRLLSCRSSD